VIVVFLGAGLAFVALLTFLMLTLPALARPTLPFGVRIGVQRVGDPAVVAARRSYTRLIWIAAALAAAVTAVTVPTTVPAVAAGGTAALLLVADLFVYHRAHRMIRAAKLAGGWTIERRQGVAVDTTFRTDPVRVPWLWGLPALAVLLLTAAIGFVYGGDSGPHGVFQPVLYQLGIMVIAVVMVRIALRARPDVDAARPKGTARRYRSYLRGIAVMSFLTAACLNLGLLFAALYLWGVVAWQPLIYIPLGVMVIGWVIWEIRVGQAGHRLPALPGEEAEDSGLDQRDDDRHWHLLGSVYINRADPALLVHDRLGSSTWTLNLGHPIAWLLLGAIALGLIALAVVLLVVVF
jgi:uncharacterized membrane protein